MADTIRLSDGTTTHDLYAGTAPGFLLLASGLKFGLPEHENLYHSSEWQDGEQLARHKLENRVWSVKLALKSGNSDDAIANQLIKLNRTVRQARRYWLEGDVDKVYLEIILSGSTTYTRYDCLDIEYINTDIFSYFNRGSGDVKFDGAVELKITTTSFGYGAEVILANSLGTPHFEEDGDEDGIANQWNEVAGTETTSLDTTTYLLGTQSQKVITNTTSSHGIYSDTVTVSGVDNIASYAWLFCTSGSDEVTLDVQADSTGSIGTATYSAATETDTGVNSNTWKRLDVIGSTTASDTTLTMRVERLSGGASKATTFYIDKTYLQLDATAVPAGWISCCDLINHHDGDDGDINYIHMTDIPGDLPALARLTLTNTSSSDAPTRIYMGVKWGENPLAMDFTFNADDGTGSLANNSAAPGTEVGGITPHHGRELDSGAVFWDILSPLDYRGSYNIMGRARGGAGSTLSYSVENAAGTGRSVQSGDTIDLVSTGGGTPWLYLGTLTFPWYNIPSSTLGGEAWRLTATINTTTDGFWDLTLIPLDHHIIFYDNQVTGMSTNDYLEISSLDDKQGVFWYAPDNYDTYFDGYDWLSSKSDVFTLRPKEDQALIFLIEHYSSEQTSSIHQTNDVSIVYKPCTEFLLGTE